MRLDVGQAFRPLEVGQELRCVRPGRRVDADSRKPLRITAIESLGSHFDPTTTTLGELDLHVVIDDREPGFATDSEAALVLDPKSAP
jgi:hypothetical protein